MTKELPCGVCCKHITIDETTWERGGVVTCKHCGTKMRIKPHPKKEQKKD